MNLENKKQYVVAVVGATGAGNTAIGLRIQAMGI